MATEQRFNVHLNMLSNEIRNATIQVLASAPTGTLGKIYYDSTINSPMSYNGTAWIPWDATKSLNIPLTAIESIGAGTLVGNPTGSSALPSTITRGSGLAFSGTTLTATGSGGSVTSVAVATANGISGTVATATTTPVITLTLGAITPSSVAATGTVTGSNLSGTNTGDQTTITGNAGSATVLQTARTIALSGGATGTATSFDGSANITIPVTSISLSTVTGTLGIGNGGTGQTTATAAFNALSPMTTLGDIVYQSSGTAASRLPGNTTIAKQYLSQTGTGTISAAPAWATVDVADITGLGTLATQNGTFSGTSSGTNTGDQTISLTGDVTGAGTGTFATTISAGAVTLSKMASFPLQSLMGNPTGAAATPSAITLGSGLAFSGTTLISTGSGGTVTSVSVVSANGISGSVATATTTPAITLTLGAITPTSVAATGTVTGSNLSGTNTGDQTNITGNAGTATAVAGGVANEILFQTAPSVTSFISAAANSVLVTNGSSVPSLSTTLPAALSIPDLRINVAAVISAAGTTQATATTLASDYNVVTTAAAGSGVKLQTAVIGKRVIVRNSGANPVLLYPATGGYIDANAVNIGVSIPVGGHIALYAISSTQWYSTISTVLNAAYLTGTISSSLLDHNTITIGTTSIALGSSATTITGLTSVTSTTFVGALTGNASTATILQTARTINGVSFNGSANITIKAATPASLTAGNGLTGTTFNGSVASTFALGTPSTITGSTTNSTTSTSHTHALTLTSGDITGALGYTPLSLAGGTLTGALILAADPTVNLGAATKQYVDNAVTSASAGLDPKDACNVGTTANITLSGIQTIDGFAGAAGYRVLVKNQTTTSQNGIYVMASGAWARATDAVQGTLTEGALTLVLNGTVNAGTQWYMNTPDPITVGTTAISWIQFNAVVTYTNGDGLNLTGTTFSVKPTTGITVTTSGVGADFSIIPRKYSTLIGDGTTTSFTITHNLGTQDIGVFIRNVSTNDLENAYYSAPTTNTCTVGFTVAPATNSFKVTIIG